jgi:hypothetical protein
MPRCFVISPIGEAGSPVREHADEVWRFIVQPALKALGMEGYRSDHTVESGKITRQIYDAILKEDFCIAILTFHNPNVFYEMAIAQAAGKPVIIMVEKGTAIPFDLMDSRSIFYDLKPTPLFEGVYTQQLQAMIESVAKTDYRAEVPFGVNLTPMGAAPAAVTPSAISVSYPAERYFRSEDWIALLQSVKERFYLCGYGFTGWPIMPHAKESLEAAAKRGCDLRVMTYCVSNPAFDQVMNQERLSSDSAALGAAFETTRGFFRKAIGSKDAVRPIKRGVIFQQLVLADDELIVIPYLFSADTGHGSLIRCACGTPLYESFKYEFDALWELNAPA